MKIFGVIFFSLIFTVFLFMAFLIGMGLLYSEIYHIQDSKGRVLDVFFPSVSIFVSIWFIYIIVKIGNIRKEEEKQILEEERKAHELAFESKKIAEEKIRKEKEKAEDKRIKEEQKRILDEELNAKIIAEEKIRKEKEKQQAAQTLSAMAEEYARRQAESDRLSGERIAAQKVEDKRRREEEKQQAEEYARRQAESDRLSGERIAAQIAEEKTRKEEEKQNNGYYIEIDTNGKTEISGPFEEKKIKDFFDAGKLNLTSKIKKGVKTKSFSSLSTFKTFTEGLDDWL